jgi:signal transduction histidine kinase
MDPVQEIERLRERLENAGRDTARLRHDVSNPLTAIAGLAELLLMKEKQLSPEAQHRLRSILENCTKIGVLLKSSGRGGTTGGRESGSA